MGGHDCEGTNEYGRMGGHNGGHDWIWYECEGTIGLARLNNHEWVGTIGWPGIGGHDLFDIIGWARMGGTN